MNSLTNISPKQLRKAANIQEKLQHLQKQLEQILGASAEPGAAELAANGRRKKRRMSAAGRRAIAAAARARWAKIKGTATAKPARKKRTMSPAAKKRMAAMMKARWAARKAAGKSSL